MRAGTDVSGPGLVIRKDVLMSYSMLEPESEPICECKYDAAHDRMDREDCFFHCDMEDEVLLPPENQTALKKPPAIAKRDEENAA